jgi:predicted esterase
MPWSGQTHSEANPFFPLRREYLAGEIVRRLGADVDERIYPGMAHLVNQVELDEVGEMSRRSVEHLY